ncbi:MAG: bactofilin family protein [Anaerolineae bacterium]
MKRLWLRLGTVVALLALALWCAALPALADDGSNAVLGQDYRLAAGEELHDDLVVLGGTATLEPGSTVYGDVTIMGGVAHLGGRVDGSVVALGGTVDLEATALIEGDLMVVGGMNRHAGAVVRGNVVEGWEGAQALQNLPDALPRSIQDSARTVNIGGPLRALRTLAGLALLLLLAVLVQTLLPAQMVRITQGMTGAWMVSVGIGLVTLLVVAVLTPLLAILLIGIPLALVLLAATAIGILVGWVAAGRLVGERLLRALRVRQRTVLLEVLAGTLLISLLAQIPCLGGLMALLVICWGLGAVVLTRFGSMPLVGSSAFGAPTGEDPWRPTHMVARPRDTKPLGKAPQAPSEGNEPQPPEV